MRSARTPLGGWGHTNKRSAAPAAPPRIHGGVIMASPQRQRFRTHTRRTSRGAGGRRCDFAKEIGGSRDAASSLPPSWSRACPCISTDRWPRRGPRPCQASPRISPSTSARMIVPRRVSQPVGRTWSGQRALPTRRPRYKVHATDGRAAPANSLHCKTSLDVPGRKGPACSRTFA